MLYKAIFNPVNKLFPVAVFYESKHKGGSKENENDAKRAYFEKYGEECSRIILIRVSR